MTILIIVLLVLGAICFAGASRRAAFGNLDLQPLGLLFWILAVLTPYAFAVFGIK